MCCPIVRPLGLREVKPLAGAQVMVLLNIAAYYVY